MNFQAQPPSTSKRPVAFHKLHSLSGSFVHGYDPVSPLGAAKGLNTDSGAVILFP